MDRLFLDIAIVVGCSAVLAWLAAVLRQPIILAYIVAGAMLGPSGFGAVPDTEVIYRMSHIGVTLLLFIAGLVLHPQHLAALFRSTAVLTLGGCALSWLLSFAFLQLWGFGVAGASLGAAALMFSSTILITKLLPTTALHQQHMGAVCIAVLVAQDIVAVLIILLLGAPADANLWIAIPMLFVKAAVLVVLAFGFEQVVLRRMMRASQRYNEVLMLLCLGWCLACAVAAQAVGLTYEVGAFIAGVVVARGRIARVLSEELKVVRDFFLVFFFFALGAKLNLYLVRTIWLPALLLAGLILALRPLYMAWLLRRVGEQPRFAREVGVRMGQGSEFALIIVAVAVAGGQLTERLSQLVQLTVIATMAASAYLVATRYPTPISAPRLKKD